MYDNPLMSSTYAMSAKYRFERVDLLVRSAIFENDISELAKLKKEITSQLEQGNEDLAVVQERAIAVSSKEIARQVQSKVAEYQRLIETTLKNSEAKISDMNSFRSAKNSIKEYVSGDVLSIIQKKLTDLTDDAAETGYTFRLDSEARNAETVRFFYIVSISLILITFFLALFLSRTIATPLSKYSETCLEISNGNYKKRVRVFGEKSEIAILGKSFNFMLDRVDEKDRSMKALLDGLSTAVFSFDKAGDISTERSIACKQIFGTDDFTTIYKFFKIYSGTEQQTVAESLQLLWDPEISVDFDSLITGVFPAVLTLPLGSEKIEKYITLNYKRNLDNDGNLQKVILLANDITESTEAQKNSVLQAERVDRITKASLSAESYLESKLSFSNIIVDGKMLLQKGASKISDEQMLVLKRNLHSLKGELAIMGHRSCAKLVHQIESLLQDSTNSAVDQQLVEKIRNVELAFLSESQDVLSVLGLDQQTKMIKVNAEKIQQLVNYVKDEKNFSSMEKELLLVKLNGLLQKPLQTYFQKFENYVTETAEKLEKSAQLHFDSESDEVTFSEVQQLDVVFGHLIRNSLDHGIEEPYQREDAGKPNAGQITISVHRNSADKNLKITVRDDGRGIDDRKLASKAVEKNIWSAEKAKEATKQEALNLIFLSDFSTKDVVTETSGRGVGMDAVKAEIEKLGGTIQLQTELSKGTQFIITLPA